MTKRDLITLLQTTADEPNCEVETYYEISFTKPNMPGYGVITCNDYGQDGYRGYLLNEESARNVLARLRNDEKRFRNATWAITKVTSVELVIEEDVPL